MGQVGSGFAKKLASIGPKSRAEINAPQPANLGWAKWAFQAIFGPDQK